MSKRSSKLNLSQLASVIGTDAIKEVKPALPAEKNKAAQELGRLGGLKGGKARANSLSKQRRSEIAKLAAVSRWDKTRINNMLSWSKILTESDAQQETQGSPMRFLRFTKGDCAYDYKTWFREVFFCSANWSQVISARGRMVEQATIEVKVTILGKDLGMRNMLIDHDPIRAENHSAPTTHLLYDTLTTQALESNNLTGHTVVVQCDQGNYSLAVL